MKTAVNGTISIEKLLEHLLEMREATVLEEMDYRYQKGYRDSVDTLIKWFMIPERKE